MKIRTQFIIGTAVLGIFLLVVSASVIFTNRWVDRTHHRHILATQVERDAYELGFLANEYMLYREDYQAERWEAKFAQFAQDLASMEVDTRKQQALLDKIRANQRRQKDVFAEIKASVESLPPAQKAAFDAEFMRVSWRRLQVQDQAMIFDASQLAGMLREQEDWLRYMTSLVGFIFIGVLGAFLLVNYVFTFRRTLNAIAELQAGTRIIGSGDLDFAIAVKQEDEIGELSHAFNRMTSSLKELMASKADLEKEVQERKRAEESLRESEERLAALYFSMTEGMANHEIVYEGQAALDYIVTDVNPAFENITGIPRSQAIGRKASELYGMDSPPYLEIYARVASTGVPESFETYFPPLKKYFAISVFSPGTGKFATVFVDITERHQAEESVRRMNAELEQRVAEQTAEIRLVNAKLEQRVAARTIELQTANQNLQASRLAALNLMEDTLAAQKQLEQVNARLRESERHLSRAQEIAHLGSWELDLELNQLSWSDEVYRIFGLQPQQFAATYEAFLEAVHPDDRAAVDAAYSGSIREGRDRYEIEHRVIRQFPDKEIRIVHEKCEHFRNEEGRIIRSVGMVHDITERKRAEEALRLSEEKFRSAFANASIGFAMTTPDGRFVDANPAYCTLTGYKIEELQELQFLNLVHPGDRPENMKLNDQMQAGEISDFVIENRYVRKNGETVWVRKSVSLVRNAENAPQWVIALVEDITERKQAEESLRRSEALLMQTGEAAKVGGWELDLETMTPYWSSETYRIHEVDPSVKLDLDTAIQYYAPEARAQIAEAVRLAVEAGQAYDLELPLITAKGRNIWIRAIGQPEFQEGKCVRFFGAFQDITEYKRAEEQLRYQAALLSNVNDAIVASDAQFCITAWNSAAESLYGWKANEVMGRSGVEIVCTEWPQEDASQMRRMIAEAGRWRGEATQVRKDGTRFPVEISSIVLRDHRGQATGYISVNRDITQRKQVEETLRKAHDELELRVQERTKALVKEIAERKEVERQLRIRTTAMEAAANGIIITDPRGCIQWTNPALLQITGYTGGELVGQNMRIFHSGVHDLDYYHRMWGTILSGQVWRGEVTNQRKDGSLYVEDQTITPVRDDNNQIQHFIAIKQDITERKRAEAELAERNVELQALSLAEHKQRRFSESLAEAALVLNKSMNLEEVLPQILEQVKAVIPYQLAIVMMFDGDAFYDASHAGDERWTQNLAQVKNRFPLADFPLLKKMRQSRLPVLIPDTQKEKSWMIVHGLEWGRSILCVPLLAENQVIGFLNLLAEQPDFFTAEMEDRLVVFAAHASVAIQNAWLFEQVRASSERLQSLSRRLVEIQENERLYIARELHDEAGQMLTALMLDLVGLESQAHDPEAVLKKVVEMEQSLNAVSENLHSVAMALRPASLDHLGLVPALRQYVESIGERYRLKVSFLAGNFQERLPADMETELYRIVQEALTNVARHARASQVDVILTTRDRKLIVMVEDDGNGFDPEKVPDTGHLGLFGMRERAEMIGGQLMIESKPGKGTTVIVEVDYDGSIDSRR